MLGLDKATMKVVPGGAAAEAKVALGYINDLLTDCGSGIDRIVKATVLLQDINDFAAVNEVYKTVMGPSFPCRTCYQAAQLPAGANVEIEVIAYTGDVKTEHVTV
jgi:2-iminobutanoate/2-iminopropanoate deaminase